MRVLHLSTFDSDGGAARGSLWLHQALRAQGVDSLMMVGRKTDDDASILPLPHATDRLAARLRGRLDALPLRRYDKTGDAFWTLGWVPARIEHIVEEIDPDVVHLHWIGAGFLPIDALKRIGRPLVWTLRDMWPLTGGCHYTAGCERYRESCGACPQLRSSREADISRRIWERKKRHWADLDLHLVPISGWLADCVQASPLLRHHPREIIPNGLDAGRFHPSEKRIARRAWDLPDDRRIVLYGAINATRDRRKGFPELLAALGRLSETENARDTLLVVFGDLEPDDMPDLGIETRYVGYVGDDARLALLYSCADVAVMPSLQEAFGKTLIEAMACATPVVAFASGGPLDIVDHRRTGYLAKPFCPDDLAAGIAWCLEEWARGGDPGAAARPPGEA
ncbi:glycosyltransferase family 4 protein, partial [Parvibaculum sp.]|uniref:glycosyltransferase family 4 protein n=1 Tax=Parvibaculum sp. TaxID=2024848 RepID=UPI00349FFC41